MILHKTSPLAMCRSLWTHRALMLDLARREAVGRYKGSLLGVFWSLVTPLFMLTIYTLVFSHVFKAKWGGTGDESQSQFAIVLFAGLIVFNMFSECIGRAPGLVLSNVNFVKKVVFPLEILPVVNLLSAVFHASVSLLVLLVFQWCVADRLPVTALLIPLVLLPLGLLIMGASWWLAATGVYLRDIGQTIGILLTGLMFLSPIFFPTSALPAQWQSLAHLNPLATPIEQARQVLVYGQWFEWRQWALYSGVAVVIAWSGFYYFQKARKGFADVL
ncbi:ABC transporter permease [Herbaspirillum sp. DW155]|uniref:ABC transporter permease n=1 Tax=Herbaspirillum sp. DW155 TaxID=3095609 RepID=UPI0030923AB2|nr:ABC transporter permease [Herbaspirillum sp. DW155]